MPLAEKIVDVLQRYSKEFKCEAIRLLNERNKPISEIAVELGVKRTLLYRWRDQLNHKGDKAFSGPGRPTTDKISQISRHYFVRKYF